MTKYWVSHPKFTGLVVVEGEDERIVQAPPVWFWFVQRRQSLSDLRKWLNGLGPGLRVQRLND